MTDKPHEAPPPRREREVLNAIDQLTAHVERLREALRSIQKEEDPKAMKAIAQRELQ